MDFPQVDWVLSVDCPEDKETYVHRVGRTARYKAKGNALQLLVNSELPFVERTRAKGIDMKKIHSNPKKALSITTALQRINAENKELKYLAQRAVISYLRAVFLNQDKEVFDVSKISPQLLAESYGLVNPPEVNFLS